MNRIKLTILLLFIALTSFCQKIPDTKNQSVEDTTVYDLTAINDKPQFVGGESELSSFINKNLQYPQEEKNNGLQGRVYITFVIDRDGSVTNVELYKGLKDGPGCDKEAIRIVGLMPKWIPGKVNGHPAKVRYIVPIKFQL